MQRPSEQSVHPSLGNFSNYINYTEGNEKGCVSRASACFTSKDSLSLISTLKVNHIKQKNSRICTGAGSQGHKSIGHLK